MNGAAGPHYRLVARRRGLAALRLREIGAYRDLLRAFVSRDLKVNYQQTVLGPLWLLIRPLVTTAILVLMMSRVTDAPTDGAPPALFYLAATIMWTYFSQIVQMVGQVFVAHEYLFSKVYFPRLILPISITVSNLVGVGLQLAMLGVFGLATAVFADFTMPLSRLWILPLTFVPLVAFSLGTGLLVASMTTRYRDLVNALPFALQCGFLLTPIVYPFSRVPEDWRLPFAIVNPLGVISDLWRAALTGTPLVSTPVQIVAAVTSSLAVFLVAVLLFQMSERTAADTI
ncbi:ABC transporter permease [Novosphingobium sp. KCTC 2891]|uniref:ABC transporter permease n=1 Tax=Novosphingobium sp. KCTC 2891 TaxID=2989730 RepID=UPI002222AA88|nr:ABC transporter permease [Novosphingobium sp. KCTC 2891]MCW1382706.1 ABC transporter permease [Novosphingobium sp. KCTC 2891]